MSNFEKFVSFWMLLVHLWATVLYVRKSKDGENGATTKVYTKKANSLVLPDTHTAATVFESFELSYIDNTVRFEFVSGRGTKLFSIEFCTICDKSIFVQQFVLKYIWLNIDSMLNWNIFIMYIFLNLYFISISCQHLLRYSLCQSIGELVRNEVAHKKCLIFSNKTVNWMGEKPWEILIIKSFIT